MKKAVWISFDLGINGDYESLYAWLADQNAHECGDSVAFFRYEYHDDLIAELKAAIEGAIDVQRKTRIYAIYLSDAGKVKGTFLLGKRKQAPWTGYGASEEETSDES